MRTLNNLLTILASGCLVLTGAPDYVHSQEIVDTTPTNKNVVLEEYTGYLCQFCPDGHKTAEDIRSENPNSVTLVNVHTGRLAQPRGDAPDFRTDYGSSLSSEVNVRGLPSASINRKPFDFDYSTSTRDDWSGAADIVLNESSPVNVGIETNLDPESRELTIEVEAYYTDSSNSDNNKLNVALLQNNIAGPQIDGGDYYPENFLENGDYKHKHVLRDFITGQWGETIDQPYEDSLFSETYTYSIPEEIRSVPVKLNDLEVAAYVSEGRTNIYTGVSEKVSIDDSLTTDLSISKDFQVPDDICLSEVSPSFEITNDGNQEVNSFDATITINRSSLTETFNKTISAGESVTIQWDRLSLPGGDYNIQFDGISNINGGDLLDDKLDNDFAAPDNGFSFLDGALSGSSTTSFDRGLPQHFAIDNSKNPTIQSFPTQNDEVGWNKSNGAIAQIIDQSLGLDGIGEPGYITFGKIDFSDLDKPYLSFYYDYAVGESQSIDNPPEYAVQYSTDCGQNWNTIAEKAVEKTSDFSPTREDPIYIPNATDSDNYQNIRFSLSDLKEEGEVIMRIAIKPNGGGNALWTDQISTGEEENVSIGDNTALSESLEIYPNPVQDVANVKVEVAKSQELSGSIINSTGKTVKDISPRTVNSGKQSFQLDVSDLEPGIYFANVNVGDSNKNLKFIVTE